LKLLPDDIITLGFRDWLGLGILNSKIQNPDLS